MSSSAPKGRISLACIACKKRKAKCSGAPPPCQACKQSGTVCIIDESLDGRRKVAAKRTFDELTYHKTFIESLLTYIRTFDASSLEQLVDLIKADVPLTEIGALIDESMRISRQGAQPEESLRALNLDGSFARRNKRKLEGHHDNESPSTQSASDTSQKATFESQAQRLDDQEMILAFLKNTTHDEVDELVQYLATTSTTNLYDGLLQWITDPEARTVEEVKASRGSLSMSLVTSGGVDFSKARTLSLPNLYQYQRYLQGLFSEYKPKELQEDAVTGSQARREWHPALKLRFSSSGESSDESNGGEPGEDTTLDDPARDPGVTAPQPDTKGKSRSRSQEEVPQVSKPNANRLRLRIDNDPQAGEDFQLSPALPLTQLGYISIPKRPTPEEEKFNPLFDTRMSNLNLPLYQLLPLTGIDDSPLSRSYTSYRDEARSMILHGVPIQQVIATSRIEVNLLFRPRNATDAHSVCNWASELCVAFRRDLPMPWIMACVLMLSRLMRWLLVPTEETYNEIPPMMRPTQNQRFIPHNPAADLNPIPGMRDALCIKMRDYITPLIGNAFFEWPHSLEDAVEYDAEHDVYMLTQQFETQVHKPQSWSLSRRVLKAFPELATRPDVNWCD